MINLLYSVVKAESKHHLRLPLVTALAGLGTAWLVIGTSSLDPLMLMRLVERFLPLIGLFLLIPLVRPEDTVAIKELLLTKYRALETVFFTRLFTRFVLLALLLSAYLYPVARAHAIDFGAALLHSFAIAVLVSGLGVLVAVASHNLILGYLAAFFVMISQWFGRPEQLGWFYLGTWQADLPSRDPIYLLLGLSLMVLAFLRWKTQRLRSSQ